MSRLSHSYPDEWSVNISIREITKIYSVYVYTHILATCPIIIIYIYKINSNYTTSFYLYRKSINSIMHDTENIHSLISYSQKWQHMT